jgi:tRNA(Arg) A34 adenosine deaminase TadA
MKDAHLALAERIAEQVAFDLIRQFGPDYQYAWVIHQNKIYFSRCPKNLTGPACATTKLIQFLFDQYVDQSFFILRNRIYTTERLTPMSEGMVQLAAKRASGNIQARDHVVDIPTELIEIGSKDVHYLKTRHEADIQWKAPNWIHDAIEAQHYLQNLIAQIPRGDVLHDFNRPIAVFVVDPNGKLLSWAVNNNSKNKTLHAETAALLKYYETYGQKLPAGSTIYASMKPCRMCAGMIVEMCENPDLIKVIYFQDDPGPLAQNTELEKRKRLQHYQLG